MLARTRRSVEPEGDTMPNGIYSAMTGALAQEEHMDIVANNLANGSTDGFKAVQAT